jgi:hypothetical protein
MARTRSGEPGTSADESIPRPQRRGRCREILTPIHSLVRKPSHSVEEHSSEPEVGMALLTVEQAAEFFGTRPRFIRQLIEPNRIGPAKLCPFARPVPADRVAFVAAGVVGAQPHGPQPSTASDCGKG